MAEVTNKELQELFLKIGLQEKNAKDLLANKKLKVKLYNILKEHKVETLERKQGNLLYQLVTTFPFSIEEYMSKVASYIIKNQINNPAKFNAAMAFLKTKGKSAFTWADFEKSSGVGIELTEEQLSTQINELLKANEQQLLSERYLCVIAMRKKVMEAFPFSEGAIVIKIFNSSILEKLGPENEEDKKKKQELAQKKKEQQKQPQQQQNKELSLEEQLMTAEYQVPVYNLKNLREAARDVGTMNTDKHLEEHKKFTGGKIYTRFPPEPNGYLHIGHAKAMRFSFLIAQQNNGETYLRFDDTNPEKESMDCINSITNTVAWLGYKPFKITHASDNFEALYNFAITLIKKGKAYVSDSTPEEMSKERQDKLKSPHRDRPIEENLALFENMAKGLYDEKTYCLRLKVDYQHANPTLRDPVCYRVRYIPHPHKGNKWCVYPCYDFTHCICDSLEHIDYSCCTLEFEIRRELYYWVLEQLDLYKPLQYEFSRLNISNTVLSKRKIQRLIKEGYIWGWDDPRIYTVEGMKRRGYTADSINMFCDKVSVTRRSNEMVISYKLLEFCARQDLNTKAKRRLCVLEPIKMTLTNVADDYCFECEAPNFPMQDRQEQQKKGMYKLNLKKILYVDKEDVRDEDHPKFFGFAPNKVVGLKYAKNVKVLEVLKNEKGEIVEVKAELLENSSERPKTYVHWLSADESTTCEVRLFEQLCNEYNPNTLPDFTSCVNKNSLTIHKNAKINKLMLGSKIEEKFQFERLGYFAVDKDSKIKEGQYIFNRVVTLVEKQKIKAFQENKK